MRQRSATHWRQLASCSRRLVMLPIAQAASMSFLQGKLPEFMNVTFTWRGKFYSAEYHALQDDASEPSWCSRDLALSSSRVSVTIRRRESVSHGELVFEMSSPWGQDGYGLRFEWGLVGAQEVASPRGALVIVDVLSFTDVSNRGNRTRNSGLPGRVARRAG